MNILALSTSGRAASAALIRDGITLRLAVSDNGLTHSETIMSAVDSLFAADAPISFDELDAFAADIGPGSFTGVRIGVCIANAFASASNKPVAGISSLEALALAASYKGTVAAIIDAHHGNGYGALYDNGRALIPPEAIVIEEFLQKIPVDTLFTGDGAAQYRELIERSAAEARFTSDELQLLRADMLARPAFEALKAGRGKNEVMPLYLRQTQAERLYKEKK